MGKHGRDKGPQTPDEIRAALGEMTAAANEPQDPRTCRHRVVVELSGVRVCNECMSNLGPAKSE